MKKYLNSVCFLLVCSAANATQTFVHGGVDNSAVYSFVDSEVIVEDEAVISSPVGVIDVAYAPVHLYNAGTINSSINADGNNLFVYNSGVINGVITNGNITQIMQSNDYVTNINVTGANFRIEIDGIDNLDFNSIKNMSATNFNIKESSVVINDFTDWQNWDKTVSVEGPLVLIITDKDTVHSGDVIAHVVKNDNVSVQIPELDNLHKVLLSLNGNDIVLNIVRETDYNKVDDSAENSLLEEIRAANPNDKLLKALDAAETEEEINRLKPMSYHFNHHILLRPIKVVNNFSSMNIFNDETDFGLGIIPFFITSDSISDFGGRIYIGNHYENFYLNFGLNLNSFTYEDDFNDFSGIAYGLDLKAKQVFDKLWLGEKLGLTLATFDAKYVYNEGSIKNNPMGMAWDGEIDVGYDIDVVSGFNVSPVVGLVYQKYSIVDVSESDFYMHGGADAKYSFVTDGIKYEYSVSGSMGSNGNLYSAIKVGFWSITDDAGVSISTGILKDDFDCYYQLSANARMLF